VRRPTDNHPFDEFWEELKAAESRRSVAGSFPKGFAMALPVLAHATDLHRWA